jgi:hypothetical protein
MRASWIRKYGAESFGAIVDFAADFCGIWQSSGHPFQANRFRAEVYRE